MTDVAEGRVPLVTARSFRRADGLRTLEANGGRQPAAFRAHDGRLWFATARGAAIVDPSRIPPAAAPLAPVIERVTIEGRTAVRPSSALDEVRTISAPLHPAMLERLGLVSALSAMIRARVRVPLAASNGAADQERP